MVRSNKPSPQLPLKEISPQTTRSIQNSSGPVFDHLPTPPTLHMENTQRLPRISSFALQGN